MHFGKSYWKNFERASEREWLLTNGIGGFACSTIGGANTRRYHCLLAAAQTPPGDRKIVLSKIDESVTIEEETFDLYSCKAGNHITEGYRNLEQFSYLYFPIYTYLVREIIIEKCITMVYGKNITVISYRIINGKKPFMLRLTPLVNYRDYHHTSRRHHMVFDSGYKNQALSIIPYNLDKEIKIKCTDGIFKDTSGWFENMEYDEEKNRGLDYVEDHFIPGTFEIEILPGEEKNIYIYASLDENIDSLDGQEVFEEESLRLGHIISSSSLQGDFPERLSLAADKFIVQRKSTNSKTVIAGYPWFGDWGRDTMIALPGLTLTTKRYKDAKDILYTFSKYIEDGLIPNMFPDEGQQPLYNSVDAALWYFEAVNSYLQHTWDYSFIKENIFHCLKSIIMAYINGTVFDIKMEEDGLVTAGSSHTQLTWMDAKVDDYVPTPRHGKAVEINALWYNALSILKALSEKYNKDPGFEETLLDKVKNSFKDAFWNEEKQCLYDVVNKEYRDPSVRPNQIFAVSLSNPVADGEMALKIVDRVFKDLYTPYGLRSLSNEDSQYRGTYFGDRYQRDAAYHQGTVWAWLLGPFLSAYLRVNGYSEFSRRTAFQMLEPVKDHLRDGCIGNISEIFDGNYPHYAKGCFAQAWSVGEILRVYDEIKRKK